MKEWFNRQLSGDQGFGDLVIGCVVVCAVFFISIGVAWFFLFAIVKSTLNFCKWLYKRRENQNETILDRFWRFDYFIDETYHKFNVFELKSNIKERLSPKGLLKFTLFFGVFWGIVAMIVAFVFVYSINGNPYYEYQLLQNGTTTEGFITDVTEEVEPSDAGGYTYYYYYTFKFKLPNGNTIKAYQELSGSSAQETPDLNEPYPTEIVYLKNNPEINKIKSTLSDSIWEIVWRKIGLGLILLIVLSSIGFVIARNALKEYLTASKKLVLLNDSQEIKPRRDSASE
jgi:hypothetical protein